MRKITSSFIVFSILVIGFNCTSKKSESNSQASVEQQASETISYKLEEVWATEASLKTPESVIYDEARGILYVSNVNENPWEKDNNGFISKVSLTGEILDLEWISGFSGPKGMAIVGNILFVADMDEVGLIDIEKGELVEKILLEGASGLNDITPDGKGGVFISDSNEGKLYQYANGEVNIFHADTPGRPNGLFVDQGKLFVAFSQASDFVTFDIGTLEKTFIAGEIGGGDGVTPTNEADTYLVSDWNGEIFIIDTDGNKQSLLNTKEQKKNTADIWFIKDQNLVLVPTFFDNRIVAYKLVKE